MDIKSLLQFGINNKASDIHVSSGVSPSIRVNGDMRKINLPELSPDDVKNMMYGIMDDVAIESFEQNLELDFALDISELARFRVNVFQQLRGISAVFRIIPNKIPSLERLGSPDILRNICSYTRGLVLVTGPTGSGKSTTLAAMTDYINENYYQHILTVEDPIEFIHSSKNSLINQRELNSHTNSFNNALRSALREDPDTILVGELRDLETIRLALTAAETGHLVFATLHTSSASKTIDRIIDVFPPGEKDMVRVMLSESLRAVISQRLIKTLYESSRVACYEIMIVNSAIRNLIRENKIPQINNVIQTNQQNGMQTNDQGLLKIYKNNTITLQEALRYADQTDLFQPK